MTTEEKKRIFYDHLFGPNNSVSFDSLTEIDHIYNVVDLSGTLELKRTKESEWDLVVYMIKIGDRYFQYTIAEDLNNHNNVFDLGYVFDWDQVFEVEPYTEIVEITKYRRKNE